MISVIFALQKQQILILFVFLGITHQTIRVLKQMLYYIALVSFYLPSKELRAYDLVNIQASIPIFSGKL